MRRKRINLLAALVLGVSLLSTILPSTSVYAAGNETLKLNGKAAASMDLQTGEIIYSQNMDDKMYPASMTKLMTAVLFAENKSKSDLIKYTESAKAQPQYALSTDLFRNIKIGDTMSADDVMKALLLFSANDSAYMIADSVAGNSQAFIKMMNDKAASLNMKGTNYVTANGLHDNNHYTTAFDMLLLGRAAYSIPWVKETMGLKKDGIRTSTGSIGYIENRNKLLGKDGNIGGKTGYTDASGRCLVAFYERDGRSIATVVMKAAYDAEDITVFKDTEALANWSFAAKKTSIYQKDTTIKTETISYKPFKFFGPTKTFQVPVILKDEVSYYENDINKKELKTDISVSTIDPWNLSADAKVGKLTVKTRNYEKTYDLYSTVSTQQIKASNKTLYAFAIGGAAVVVIVFLLLLFLIVRGIGRRGRGSRSKRYR